MREILFRGKRKDNGEWVEGDLVRLRDGARTISCIYGFGEVIPSTVGQYTGLTDKNGRRIFEGDLLRYSYEYPGSPWLKGRELTDEDYHIGAVFWQEWRGTWAVCSRGKNRNMNQDVFVYSRNPNRVEVIGNVHDNPELLEVKG